MKRAEFELTGFKELEQLLKELPQEIQVKTVRKSFRDGAKEVQRAAQQNCPVLKNPEKHPKRTAGDLKASIKVGIPKKSVRMRTENVMRVFSRHPLAHLVEFGSYITGVRHHKSGKSVGRMPAFGIMRKAVDEKGRAAIEHVGRSMAYGIEKVAAQLARRKGGLK